MKNKTNLLKKAAGISLSLILGLASSSALAEWAPKGPINMMIGYKAGGGADTHARLIAEEIEKRKGWKIIPTQVTGRAGLTLAKKLKQKPGKGTSIGLVVSEVLGYSMLSARKSGIQFDDFAPISSTVSFQMGIVSKSDRGWKTFQDVIDAAKSGKNIRFAVMSAKHADLAYLLGKENGVKFNIIFMKGGKAVMNGINAGDVDVGFVGGNQNKSVLAGDLINLASAKSTPLLVSPDAPLLSEYGVNYSDDGFFMFVANKKISQEARDAIAAAITEVANDPSTKAHQFMKKAFGGVTLHSGDELTKMLETELNTAKEMMKAAGE